MCVIKQIHLGHFSATLLCELRFFFILYNHLIIDLEV